MLHSHNNVDHFDTKNLIKYTIQIHKSQIQFSDFNINFDF